MKTASDQWVIVSIHNNPVWINSSNEVIFSDIDFNSDSEIFTAVEESLLNYLAGWVVRKCSICLKCQIVLTKPEREHAYDSRQ